MEVVHKSNYSTKWVFYVPFEIAHSTCYFYLRGFKYMQLGKIAFHLHDYGGEA